MTLCNRVRLIVAAVALMLLSNSAVRADEFKTHYDLALALYNAQRYEDSIPEFKAANKISPKPGLLFNLAQAYRKAGHPREAIEYYDQYLSSAPELDSETRRKVDGYLSEARNTLAALELEMKQRLAEEKARQEKETATVTPAPTPAVTPPPPPIVAVTPPPPPPSKPVYKKWWFWTIIGGAAVVAGTAIGLGVGLSSTSSAPRGTIKLM